jgi:hypothetical protein
VKLVLILSLILLLLGAAGGVVIWQQMANWNVATTLSDLLNENQDLKAALARLTAEEQIGYAKVLSQQEVDGRLTTTVRFVETAREDQRRQVLCREFDIPGDVVHFDALIVRFPPRMVQDGEARALYLWRRIYGETMAPEEGFPIVAEDGEPPRYAGLLDELPPPHRAMFWEAIWSLANDPQRLSEHGIRAVYGNALYTRMVPGLIYVFRIGPTGDFSVESIPDL